MKWCAFDVETRGPRSEFVGGAIYSDRAQVWMTNRQDWVQLLQLHAQAGYTLVAHNAEYDITTGLWPAGCDVTIHYYNGAFTAAYWFWHPRKASCQIWDSLNWSGGLSLAKVGESIGLPKYPMPRQLRDADDVRQDWVCEPHSVRGCLECYGLRDAEIVYRYMTEFERFLDGYGIEPRRTLAGIAVSIWHYFDPGKQQQLRSEKVVQLARRAYHGGRAEVFRYGTFAPVHTYDIRSHYPSVMIDERMPDCRYLLYAEGNPSSFDFERVEGVIEAEVYQPPTHFPVLPAVHEGRIYYPVGQLRDCWTIRELRAALARGAQLLRVHRMAWSDRFVYPFTDTMGALLLLRDEYRRAGDPREAVVKPLMNSISGRLGMVDGGERRIYRQRVAGQKPWKGRGIELEVAGTTAYEIKHHQVPRPPTSSNVLWAANVTGAGRLRLLEALERAGESAVYCDTDSVITTSPLELGEQGAGRLRDTGTWKRGMFLSPKHYRLEGLEGEKDAHAKGIPRDLAERYFETGEVNYQAALGVIEAVNSHQQPGSWVEIKRSKMHVPARRQLLNPAVLRDRSQISETSPVVFSADGPEEPAVLIEVSTSA